MYNKYEVDPSLSFGYEINQNLLCDTTSEDLLKMTGDADVERCPPRNSSEIRCGRRSTAADERKGHWQQPQLTPLPPQSPSPRQSPARLPQNQAVANTASRPDFVTPRAPTPAPEVSEATPSPPVKVRTEQQQARIRKKFLQMREKKMDRELSASQQHRLAKQPAPPSDPEGAGRVSNFFA